jgi:hypothetical protein
MHTRSINTEDIQYIYGNYVNYKVMVNIIHKGYNSAERQGNVVDMNEYFNNLIRVSRFQFSTTTDNFNKKAQKQNPT